MTCHRPRRTASGEFECPECGVMWSLDDLEPDCPRTKATADRRARTAIIAARELCNIRAILRKGS